jgi:hypothetical protein
VNTRVAVLVDGARYGGRVDDVVGGALVVAAPDLNLSTERPVIVEWRDAAGTWQLPAEVTAQRTHPFPTTSVRPTGASECVAAPAADRGLRVAARVLGSSRLPEGTRVPVTTLNLRRGQLALWTILPLEKGDRIECMARIGGGSRLVRVACTVASAEAQSGTWLVRAECQPDDASDPDTAALIGALVAGEGGTVQTLS